MKKTAFTSLCILLAIAISIWWVTSRPSNSPSAPTPVESGNQANDRPPTSGQPEEIPRPFNATPEQSRAIDEENERRHAEFMNIPIIFYGRVVDQDSKPLSGVEVLSQVERSTNLVEHYAHVDPVTKCIPVLTDASGRFTVQGPLGYHLSIISITKSGYRKPWQNGSVSYDRRLPNCHKPNANKPVEFILISEALPQAEKAYEKRIRFEWNASPVKVDLGNELGSLTLTPRRSGYDPTNLRTPFDWSFDVHASGFEIARLTESLANIAPINGYLPSHLYDYPRNGKGWGYRVNGDKYAIRTKNAKYGLMELDIHADGDGNFSSCWVTIHLNQSGARNIDHK